MPNPDKAFWWHMHQKPSYEFDTGKNQLFPLSFVPVIFYRKSDGFIIHADNAVIADGNPMGIFSKVINHRLCTVKSFLTIRNPFCTITGIKQFFERNHTWNRDIIPRDIQDIPIEKTDGRIIKIQSCGFQPFLFFRKQKIPDILAGKFFRIFTLIFQKVRNCSKYFSYIIKSSM